jgi:hypothetical protein
MVKVVVPVGGTPPNVTLGLLKLHPAPKGKPEQLLGVKLTVPAPVIGVIVKVTIADCPAGTELEDRDPAVIVKSAGTTVMAAGVEVEEFSPLPGAEFADSLPL